MASRHAKVHDALEHATEDRGIAEAAVAVFRKSRGVRNGFVEREATEPAVCEIEPDLLDEAPLGPDAIQVADQQHAQHQLGGDRRSARAGIIRLELGDNRSQVEQLINATQQMIGRHKFLKPHGAGKRS